MHIFRRLKFFTLILCTALLSMPLYAQAQYEERYTSVEITPEKTTIEPNESITIATTISLKDHWHVYWKNPGDSGLPVKITWHTPSGISIGDISWPTPERIDYDFLTNYGYYDEVTLLQTLEVSEALPPAPIKLTASIEMLVCKEICIPEYDDITITLNGEEGSILNGAPTIETARKALPTVLDTNALFNEEGGSDLTVIIPKESHAQLRDAKASDLEFFPYPLGIINHNAKPKVSIKDKKIIIKHERGSEPVDTLDVVDGVLILKDKSGKTITGFEITAKPGSLSASSEQAQESSSDLTWITALYLAIIGGIILNLMPCVFPVLSMKALSLVHMKDSEAKKARAHGIAYTLGVVLSFLLIGTALVVLKEAGAAIGWGFQLQNPIVVGALAYLLFAIGLNLIGFFEFDFGLGNVGNKLTQGHGLSSSFFTGTLATIVATPCTAPFMGAAMGFAISQPAFVSLSVFAALGFGLALPYLLLSFIPASRKILPRPGAWMNRFKQLLAFPMLASAVWLVWVLAQQSGSYGVFVTLLGMLSIAFAIWLSHLKPQGVWKYVKIILFVIALLVPVYNLAYVTQTSDVMTPKKDEKFGEAFSTEALKEALASDQPVFVEMTAAWCITCKFNHATSINTQSTRTVFEENNVIFLVGDWTNQDPVITEYLSEFGRNGVPLYVFYPVPNPETGKRENPKLLPQVLTPALVKQSVIGADH